MVQFQAIWPHYGLDQAVRWRSLSWKEYRRFRAGFNHWCPFQTYIEIYRTCLQAGPTVETAPAGIVAYVAQSVLEHNALGGDPQDVRLALAAKRNQVASDYMLNAQALIAACFHYPLETIESWDADTFFQRLVMAETVLGVKLDPPEPPNPKKPGKQKPQRPRRQMNPAQAEAVRRTIAARTPQ